MGSIQGGGGIPGEGGEGWRGAACPKPAGAAQRHRAAGVMVFLIDLSALVSPLLCLPRVMAQEWKASVTKYGGLESEHVTR